MDDGPYDLPLNCGNGSNALRSANRWANLPNWRRSRVLGSQFSGSYLAAEATDFTAMVSPLAVPVTLACSQASLLSSSSAA